MNVISGTIVASRAVPPPEFYFIGTQHPRSAFLLKQANATRKADHVLPVVGAFENAILDARDRVWVLDKFFDAIHGLPCIWDAVATTRAPDVRILSHQAAPTLWLSKPTDYANVDWVQVAGAEWMHGRFALVDAQLWHFGSTVGGGYPAFDAVSCWRDDQLVKALEYRFVDAWESGR